MADDPVQDMGPREGDYLIDRAILRPVLDAVEAGDAATLTELRADRSTGATKRLRLIQTQAADPTHPIVVERINTDALVAIADKLELALQ